MSWDHTRYSSVEQSPHDASLSPMPVQDKSVIKQNNEYFEAQGAHPRMHSSRSIWMLVREWRWEFATWLLGSCALFAIIALLACFQDRALREWFSNIRLATVVAALSQASQSALLVSVSSCIGQLKWDWLRQKRSTSDLDIFDGASRGPNGSLLMLTKIQFHLVSVGALATIMLLAFSPFAQQSNTIELRIVNSTGFESNATINRSLDYNIRSSVIPFMDISHSDEFGQLRKGFKEYHEHNVRAVLSSVLSTDPSPSDIVGNCTSEACSWQPYTSLGVCASVEDISSRGVMYNNSMGHPNLRIAGANWQPPSQELSGTDIFWMAAPVGNPGNLTTARPAAITEIYVAYYPACNSTNQPRRGAGTELTEPRRNASNWKVFKGTLSACVQTLNSTYNNSMTTTIIDTHRDLNWTRDLVTHYKGEEFRISQKELDQWAALFERTLKGAAMLCEDCDNYYKGSWVPVIVNEIIGPTPWKCDPSLGLDYGLKGFTRRLNNIATSLSNSMRTQTSDGVLPLSVVQGTAWTSEQYISVDFRWLSLPCGIYLIITSFLLATIWKSRRQDVPLWKSSPLVLLEAADQHNGLQSLETVEKNAKKRDMQLKYTGKNWYLRDVTEKHHMQG